MAETDFNELIQYGKKAGNTLKMFSEKILSETETSQKILNRFADKDRCERSTFARFRKNYIEKLPLVRLQGQEKMIELRPGDIFCTRNPMFLGRAICFFEKLWSKDNQAKYSHAGIILNTDGGTFEALWTNRQQNLFEAYAGVEVLIGRHEAMTLEKATLGWNGVKKYEGNIYAGWRLLLHMIPFASKIGTGGFAVCSEMAGKFLEKSGVMWPFPFYWKGLNPDDIADIIHKWRGWSTVFEGVLPNEAANGNSPLFATDKT